MTEHELLKVAIVAVLFAIVTLYRVPPRKALRLLIEAIRLTQAL